ncbi:hypothetical protein BpHYR1_042359 [Brachionus plicatilis]|uniref:Uncharacterized protein n=1 Tax=Brachionus plicatilis TaxID=10195 RepID=A0A3M7SUJ5_BRAPC|nr:hypothetical protein BpHYR1_042359 [Brachionus plicatilis]
MTFCAQENFGTEGTLSSSISIGNRKKNINIIKLTAPKFTHNLNDSKDLTLKVLNLITFKQKYGKHFKR